MEPAEALGPWRCAFFAFACPTDAVAEVLAPTLARLPPAYVCARLLLESRRVRCSADNARYALSLKFELTLDC